MGRGGAACEGSGGSIHMGTRLKRLRWDPRAKRWTTAITTDGELKTFYARQVISSAPIRELVASIHPEPICKTAADKLRYRDFLTVALSSISPICSRTTGSTSISPA